MNALSGGVVGELIIRADTDADPDDWIAVGGIVREGALLHAGTSVVVSIELRGLSLRAH